MSDAAVYETLNRNISVLHDGIGRVREDIGVISQQVEAVSRDHATTHERLESLIAEFREFVQEDQREKRKQFAQTKLMEVRALLIDKFGHHDTVRRHAPGILQATDAGLVRENTLQTATEQLMLDSPSYWLAPGLVALSAWIRDDRALAERALGIGLKANTAKFSLFFALIARRGGRSEACGRWLVHYFQLHDASKLDRDVVVMLDAMVNGVFGGAALGRCSEVVEAWLEDLESEPGFVDSQRSRWAEALALLTPQVETDCYPTLRQYSPTWSQLESALAAARRNALVHGYFHTLFEGEIVPPHSLEAAVDDLLTKLVTEYDEEELPLKRQELHWQTLVDEDGDVGRADQRFDSASQALEERTDFAAMLTNAAMHPELSGASRATQRYAVARSKDWVAAGFSDLTAADRARVPQTVELKAGSWSGSGRDGSEETDLASNLTSHYASRITAAVNAVGITPATWMISIGAALLGVLFLISNHTSTGVILAVAGLAGGGGFFFFKYRDLDNARDRVRKALEKERENALAILRASLAELVDLRREIAVEDAKASEVTDLLDSVTGADFVIKRTEDSRRVLA